jgi:acid stress-induced BolA-like protein IbaG/YrbA
MTPEQIQQMIQQGLPGARAEVLSDDNTHFEAIVIAAAFAGKRSLQRHQMVYRTLGEFMGREIHALSLRVLTPEEAGSGRDG